VGFALPGDFLNLGLRETYGFSADAVGPVAVCRFGRIAYSSLVAEKPHLLQRLHEFAIHELTLAQEQMTLLGRRTAEEKVASFLLNLRQRWARLAGGRPSVTVEVPMSRQDIADFLGLTIETVSRTFTKLSRDRTITIVPGGVRLLDLARLEAAAPG
jgi:CRP/FNR family transcriptional regulator